MLRSRISRREEPLDTHVPDPVVGTGDALDPAHQALVADAVGLALLVVLESLAPAERLALVLHDMFAVPFDEIAPILGRTPAAARQLASRARRRVQRSAPIHDRDLPALVNGTAGFVSAPGGRAAAILAFTVSGGRIHRIDILADPDRVKALDPLGQLDARPAPPNAGAGRSC